MWTMNYLNQKWQNILTNEAWSEAPTSAIMNLLGSILRSHKDAASLIILVSKRHKKRPNNVFIICFIVHSITIYFKQYLSMAGC